MLIDEPFVGDNGDRHDDDFPGPTQFHGDEDENCEDDDGNHKSNEHHHSNNDVMLII